MKKNGFVDKKKKKNGDSRTSEQPMTTTHRRHQPLIDPMVLMILILPILVLLFIFFLSYVPKSIKPTSFKSTFNSFYLFLVLLVNLFCVLNHEDNESPTNKMVESYQDQDDIDVNDPRTSKFEQPATNTHRRHQPLIDPMVLMILILPILVLLFLYFLSYVPKFIKPTSFKSTFNSFYLYLVLLACLFEVLNNEDNESPTNKVVENYDAAMHLAVNSSTGSTPSNTSKLPPRPPQQQEAQHYDQNSHSSRTAQSSSSSMSSSSESSYIPLPPPTPPWVNSNTSSSPDIQSMGQPSTSMDGGDSFCSSPDINAKADNFIAKEKDKRKREQEKKVKKKGSQRVVKPKVNEK